MLGIVFMTGDLCAGSMTMAVCSHDLITESMKGLRRTVITSYI